MKAIILCLFTYFFKPSLQQGASGPNAVSGPTGQSPDPGPPGQHIDIISAVIMEDGCEQAITSFDTSDYPISVPDSNVTGFTLCFWLFPYRFHTVDSIVSLSFFHQRVMSVFMINGSLVAKVNNDRIKFEVQPGYRRWTHSCFLATDNVRLFYDDAYIDKPTTGLQLLPYGSGPSTLLTMHVGAVTTTDVSMSGEIADLRFYSRILRQQEMLDLKTIAPTQPKEYVSLPPILPQMPPSPLKLSIALETVELSDLNQEYEPFFIMDFQVTDSFDGANNSCNKFKARLPDVTDDADWLVKLFDNYSSNTGIEFDQFWMTNSVEKTCKLGAISSDVLTITVANCSELTSAFGCIAAKEIPFKLISDDDYLNDDNFLPIPFQNGVFENSGLRVITENNVLKVVQIETCTDLYYCVGVTLPSAIGRQKCSRPGDSPDANPVAITLSGCGTNEFTCSNGNCIPLERACDFQNDCSDNSDESFCQPFMSIPDLYDLARAAKQNVTGILQLGLDHSVYKILDVDIKNNKITFFIIIKVQWKDDRVQFKFLQPGDQNYIPPDWTIKYWHPTIFASKTIDNPEAFNLFSSPGQMTVRPSGNGSIAVVNSYEAMVHDGKDSTVIHNKHSEITVECDMDLFLYPMDSQRCCLNLTLSSVVSPIDVQWNRQNATASLSSYNLYLYTVTNFTYSVGDTPEIFGFCVTVQRRSGGYLFSAFLPCIIVEAIGLLSLVFPLHAYSDRVGVTLSCMFVIAALFIQISGDLPSSAEPRMLDIWIFASIVILLLVFVFHVVVISLHDKSRRRRGEEPDEEEDIDPIFKGEDPLKEIINRRGLTKSAWESQRPTDDQNQSSQSRITPDLVNKIGTIVSVTVYVAFVTIYMLVSYII